MAGRAMKKDGRDQADIVIRFDYEQVPAEYHADMQADAKAIRMRLIEAAGTLMDAGERLLRWKDVLPHGAWLPWVVAETGFSPQWARDAINVYRRFQHTPLLLMDLDLALPQTAVIRLATAPDAAFEDVMDRLKEGEKLRVVDVDDVIKGHRKREKAETLEGQAEAAPPDTRPRAADMLLSMADRARDELAPAVVARLVAVLHLIEDAQARLATGKSSKKKLEGVLRPHAQWLTDALEQLTQRVAVSDTKPVHVTFLDRQHHEPGPWANVAAFLRDLSHSSAWEKIPADDVPGLLQRGRDALEAVLHPDERRSFFRML